MSASERVILLIMVMAFTALVVGLSFSYGIHCGEIKMTQEAVKNNCGYWEPDKDGKPVFKWRKFPPRKVNLGLDGSKIDSPESIFNAFLWLHEDGSESPCGVCEQ